ncbi:MAG: adenylate kinase [Clostridia bacterium]|jgi:adenylate kinase|nr:adenylate kinase [Clostridia bacterium]MDD4570986.1 adenylate kinase [Clostridia bacterium]
MKLVLMGPPGAGKGTQAEFMTRKLFIPHISTGDILRAAINAGTELGVMAKGYISKGQLVPDDVILAIIKDRLLQPDCKEGFLLDGIPRNIKQAEALDAILAEMDITLDGAISIEVSPEILIDRLSGRRVCSDCSASYHMLYSPPVKDGVCDSCGGKLYQRNDDNEATIKNRLKVYEEQSLPVSKYYKDKGILIEINGEQPINLVLQDIAKSLGLNWDD